MVSKFSVMLVAFVKCMFHNNLIDGPTVQPLSWPTSSSFRCAPYGAQRKLDEVGHAPLCQIQKTDILRMRRAG
jgi:hypothetical protein